MTTKNDVLIRAFEPADIEDLTEVLNQPQATWGTMQLPYASVAQRRARLEASAPGAFRLAAVVEGKVVGEISLQTFDHPRRKHAGSIGMVVHDAHAGRGIGSALLAAVCEQADRWLNLTRLELSVWEDNARAIALYERFDFQREGLLRGYAWRDGAYVDAVCMARLRV
jgi:putative acetyltransferase